MKTNEEIKTEIPYGFCHCGCGQKTSINKWDNKKYGYIKGEPQKFIKHHHTPVAKKTHCKKGHVLTSENRATDGSCKKCNCLRVKKYANANKDKIKEYNANWRKNNPEKSKQSQVEWRKNNPDKLIALYKRRKAKPNYKEKCKQYSQITYERHASKIIQAASKWAKNNPVKRKQYVLKWAKSNPEKAKEIRRRSNKKAIATISDRYIKSKIGIPSKELPPQVIQLAREMILAKRQLKELN